MELSYIMSLSECCFAESAGVAFAVTNLKFMAFEVFVACDDSYHCAETCVAYAF